MPKLSPVSYKQLRRVFEADGFHLVREEGDHMVFTKPGVIRPVVIPSRPFNRSTLGIPCRDRRDASLRPSGRRETEETFFSDAFRKYSWSLLIKQFQTFMPACSNTVCYSRIGRSCPPRLFQRFSCWPASVARTVVLNSL